MGRIIKNCSMKRVVKLALLFAFLIPLSSLAQNIQLTGTVKLLSVQVYLKKVLLTE